MIKKKRWTPKQYAHRLRQLKAKLERAKKIKTEVQDEYDKFIQAFAEFLDDLGIQSFKDDSGNTYFCANQNFVAIDDRAKLFAWLKGHELGDLIDKEPRVNTNRLRGLYSERLEAGESIPAGIKITTVRLVRMTGDVWGRDCIYSAHRICLPY